MAKKNQPKKKDAKLDSNKVTTQREDIAHHPKKVPFPKKG